MEWNAHKSYHIWILHKMLDRIALNLEGFKMFCLKSKYPNRGKLAHYMFGCVSNSELDYLKWSLDGGGATLNFCKLVSFGI